MSYPVAVYSWNRYAGPQPQVASNGLPTVLAGANLPLISPQDGTYAGTDHRDPDQLSYSPVLLEQGVGPTAPLPSKPPAAVTAQEYAQAVANAPKPAFWNTVAHAVFGGTISTNAGNSVGAVASGASNLKTNG